METTLPTRSKQPQPPPARPPQQPPSSETKKMVSTRRDRAEAKQCVCCLSTKPLDQFPRSKPTPYCEHEIQTCTNCMWLWIVLKINGNYQPSSNIQCPDCDVEFGGKAIKANAPDLYGLFIHRAQLIIKDKQPDKRWCMFPTCQLAVQLTPEMKEAGKATCKCGAEACLVCDRPMHTNETCEEYAMRNFDRLMEEKVSERMIAGLKISRRFRCCPNCAVVMEREEMQDVVSCGRCTFRFRWSEA